MKMRSRYPPRGAYLPNLARPFDGITCLHSNLREVRIQGVDPIAMIDHHGISRVIEFLGQNHLSRLRCENRRAIGCRKTHPRGRRASFAIQYAPAPEVPSCRHILQGKSEFAFPQSLRRHRVINRAHFLLVLFHALLLLGVWLNKLLFNLEPLRGKFPRPHGHLRAALIGLAIGTFPRDFPFVPPRSFFKIYAQQRMQRSRIRALAPHRNRSPIPFRLDGWQRFGTGHFPREQRPLRRKRRVQFQRDSVSAGLADLRLAHSYPHEREQAQKPKQKNATIAIPHRLGPVVNTTIRKPLEQTDQCDPRHSLHVPFSRTIITAMARRSLGLVLIVTLLGWTVNQPALGCQRATLGQQLWCWQELHLPINLNLPFAAQLLPSWG